jgi:2-polyprenyl-3-methyl-5-hydroxy-6-metoxy-1,4-benzoquinol methylase
MENTVTSPDTHAVGFSEFTPDPKRYENASRDPQNVAMILASLVGPGLRILDVGCGTGSVTEVIQSKTNAKILGVEPDSERAKIAKERGINVRNCLLDRNFVDTEGPFDTIIFADVLEHLADPASIVEIAKKGLVPGGAIIASVPNIAHWFVRSDLLFGRFNYANCGIMDSTHLRWFTQKTFGEFFDRLGFSVEHIGCAVNAEHPGYDSRLPWRFFGKENRRNILGCLVKMFPNLFGIQIVVKAVLKS